MADTIRWNTLHCYNPQCEQIPLYRCANYEKCGHEGCSDHLPLVLTSAGMKLRLCGECRLFLWIFVPEEAHIMDGIPGD